MEDTVPHAPIPDDAIRRSTPFVPTHWVGDPGGELTDDISVMLVDRWVFTQDAWESGERPVMVATENGWRTVDGERLHHRDFDPSWRPRSIPIAPAWREPYPHEMPEFGPFFATHHLVRATETEELMAFGELAYTRDGWALGRPPSYALDLASGDVVVREWPDAVPLDTARTHVVPLAGQVHEYVGWRDHRGCPHVALLDVGGMLPIADLEWMGHEGSVEGGALQLATVLLDGTVPELAGDSRVRRAVLSALRHHIPPVGPWTLRGEQVREWATTAAQVPEIRPPLDRATYPFIPTHRIDTTVLRQDEVMAHGRIAVTREMWEGGDGVELRRDPSGLWRLTAPMMNLPVGRELEALPSRYVGFTNADGVHHAVRVYDGDLREVCRPDGSPADWSDPAGRRVLAAEMAADVVIGRAGRGDGRWRVAIFERLLEGLGAVNGLEWELPVASLEPWARAQRESTVAALHSDAPRAPMVPGSPTRPTTPAGPPPGPSLLPPLGA
jgi:hypothetical protein